MNASNAPGRLAGLFLLAVALAGCGADEAAQPTRAGQPVRSAETGPPPAPIPEAPTIALRKGRFDDVPVTVELTQVRRRGQVVNLELRLSTSVMEEVDVGAFLDDGVMQEVNDPASIGGYEGFSIDGINLIDGVNGRRFAPARDRQNYCVCDRGVNSDGFTRGRPMTVSATFGAPPPDVTAVDVVIPRFGTIPDVPLG
jgi:hypothetical protein